MSSSPIASAFPAPPHFVFDGLRGLVEPAFEKAEEVPDSRLALVDGNPDLLIRPDALHLDDFSGDDDGDGVAPSPRCGSDFHACNETR